MADVIVLELPGNQERYTISGAATGAAAAAWFKETGALVAAVTDRPKCVIVEAKSTEFPQHTLLGLGTGALLEFASADLAAAAPGTVIYSDGDGTISSVKPAGGAGAVVWMVGVIAALESSPTANSSRLRVEIAPIRSEA